MGTPNPGPSPKTCGQFHGLGEAGPVSIGLAAWLTWGAAGLDMRGVCSLGPSVVELSWSLASGVSGSVRSLQLVLSWGGGGAVAGVHGQEYP